MQQVLHDNAQHIRNHGLISCTCGRHVWGCDCELCRATPPITNIKHIDACCPICLERKRALTFGSVYEVDVNDMSYRHHEEMEQEIQYEAMTAQIGVQAIRKLFFQLEQRDVPNDTMLTVFFRTHTPDPVADKIVLGDDADGPDVKLKLGRCHGCHQDKMLCGVYCVSCALDAYNEAHPAGANEQRV